MPNRDDSTNGTGTNGEDISPGGCLISEQHEPDHHHVTVQEIKREIHGAKNLF